MKGNGELGEKVKVDFLRCGKHFATYRKVSNDEKSLVAHNHDALDRMLKAVRL